MPGESLERGTQDVYILGEDEGLILKCNEAFTDTDEDEVCSTTEIFLGLQGEEQWEPPPVMIFGNVLVCGAYGRWLSFDIYGRGFGEPVGT